MAAREDDSDVTTTASVSVLVKQAGSAVAETLHQGLRDAGLQVVVVPTAYDVVVEAQRASGTVAHVLLGVDHFGAGEFRLIPLMRREWPETVVVAYHSPGFEYKGRIAELVGADIILSTAEDVPPFLAGLTAHRTPGPAVPHPAPPAPLRTTPSPAPPEGPPTPAAAPLPPAAPKEPEPSHLESETPLEVAAAPPAASTAPFSTSPVIESYLATVPTPENAPKPQHEPQPQTVRPPADVDNLDGDQELAGGKVLGTVELTDDELRILLGEEGET